MGDVLENIRHTERKFFVWRSFGGNKKERYDLSRRNDDGNAKFQNASDASCGECCHSLILPIEK